MAKIPKKPEEIFEEITSDYKSIFGENLLSIILYGSASRGEYVKKKSDINLLIVLTEDGLNLLGDALPSVKKWRKRAVSVPLFLTPEYIKSSLDSFPIEFFNIKHSYKVIFGEDILEDISINDKELRLQLERELKGKLLHLRESFFESADNKERLKGLFLASLGAFLSIFPVIMHLKGVEVAGKRKILLDRAVDVLGLDKELFTKLWNIKEGKSKFSKGEGRKIWEGYVDQVRKIAFEIDKMPI
ncbi:MAG: hypothetical protein HWN67_20830 [Candidatus Helarchaeota archaeon]|nr:hypothetical protein [Candidatus Helarchaeota archaeon]